MVFYGALIMVLGCLLCGVGDMAGKVTDDLVAGEDGCLAVRSRLP